MKTQSAKAKGRKLQQWVRDQIIEHRKIKMKQINRNEALEAFKIWQNKEDKIKY